MPLKALRNVANRLGGAANKRVSRLRKAGIESPAIQGLTESFRFKRGGKTESELIGNIMESRAFLSEKTSTVSGVKEQLAREKLKERGIDVDTGTVIDFWKEFDKLEDKYPFITAKDMKYKVIETINEVYEEKKHRTLQTIRLNFGKAIEKLYMSLTEETKSAVDTEISSRKKRKKRNVKTTQVYNDEANT